MAGETDNKQPGSDAPMEEVLQGRPRSKTLPWPGDKLAVPTATLGQTEEPAALTYAVTRDPEPDGFLIKKPPRSANSFSPIEKRALVILLGSTIGLLTALLLILFLPGLLPTLAALFQLIGLPGFLGRIVIDLLGVFLGVLIAALLERAIGEKGDENASFMQRLIIFTTVLMGITLGFLVAAMHPIVFEFFLGLVGPGLGVYALIGLAGILATGLAVGAVVLIEWLVRKVMEPTANRSLSKQEMIEGLEKRDAQRGTEAVAEASKDLPAGWKAYPGGHSVAYHNTITKENQWDRPTAPAGVFINETAPAPQADISSTREIPERATTPPSDISTSSRLEFPVAPEPQTQPLPAADLNSSSEKAQSSDAGQDGVEFGSPITPERRPSNTSGETFGSESPKSQL